MSGLGLWIQGQSREKWRGPWSLNNQWMSHLKNKHPKQHQEVLKMNTDVRTADSQKRLLEEEADEMENTQKAHLRTEAEREEFL